MKALRLRLGNNKNGTDKIVEIDEALMGKKHGWLKHGNNNKTMKVWVVGFAERLGTEEKSMRFRVVKGPKLIYIIW